MTDGALRLLTLNVGLLRVRLLGRTLVEVPHLGARLRALPGALAADGADVLCLQEAFRPDHRDHLVAGLRDTHPHVVRADDRRRGLTHGLLLLSRHPLRDGGFTPFRAAERWQRVFVRQGVLTATVAVPGVGDVRVVDVHTTAGWRAGPEAAAVEELRDRQLAEAHALATGSGLPALLCGDLNAGPQASRANFAALLARGWTDPAPAGNTWDPDNALNAGGPFPDSPAQRVDHVLLDPAAGALLAVRSAQVVHDQPVVPVPGGAVTLSDHAGVRVELVPR